MTDKQRVGTTADGSYMIVRVELSEQDGTSKQTIDHEAAPSTFLRLSISGELYKAHTSPLRGHDAISAGQNRRPARHRHTGTRVDARGGARTARHLDRLGTSTMCAPTART